MMISYAQRMEDYHLARAFADQAEGIYVDIGAGHPVADNVSYWFYLAGWRGLVVEPQTHLVELYRRLRPRDEAVEALVGRAAGEADFYAFGALHGFSTMRLEHARAAALADAEPSVSRKRVTTLATLCREAGIERIDFLKIDVEGAEADVLAGADWSRWRPRLILAEAVAPVTMAETWPEWEPHLVDQGYRFALFDGLNRYYVAEEEAGLRERLPTAPADWGAVRHLYELGRAPENPLHPDHRLARTLVEGFLSRLPALDPGLIEDLARPAAGEAPSPGSDAFRAALGRIAAVYDGGLMLEEPAGRDGAQAGR
jgi:FkbM family methyltransferase